MPYVSVVIPAYNRQRTIEKSLKAVKDSSYQDYELIVVDCGSQDETCSIAKEYADRVIELHGKPSKSNARTSGIRVAKGEIIVNIDSDVIIRPDTLARIASFFSIHQEVDALTGLLSKEHPNSNFFSQYKNLYMHYIFRRLPERVTFLYGSIHAVRRGTAQPYDAGFKVADDTALGQKLFSYGKKIAFLKDLEVVHLKRYNLFSFIKNDFQVPYDWAKIFLKYRGWRQLGRNKTGFAHSSKRQLLSVILAPTIFLTILLASFDHSFIPLVLPLIFIWFFINFGFLAYLTRERNPFFGLLASFVTFLDNIVMASGILCGFAAHLMQNVKRNFLKR